MKKAISILTVLFLLLSFTACNAEKTQIEDCEWQMRTVMSNNIESSYGKDFVVAVGEPDEAYPGAAVSVVCLTAADGTITVTDITNDKVYDGIYKKANNTPAGAEYEIEINGKSGYAAVAPTEYYDGAEIPTLTIILGGYSMYFIPKK